MSFTQCTWGAAGTKGIRIKQADPEVSVPRHWFWERRPKFWPSLSSVGACGLWSASVTNVSIASRLHTNDSQSLISKLTTACKHSQANVRMSTNLFVLFLGCSRRVCLQHAHCVDKIQPKVYLLGHLDYFYLD